MGDEEAAFHLLRLPDTRQAWDRYDLEQIWHMVRDEDGSDSFAQVAAWYRMARLCTDQADQLSKAMDQLMAKWPPNPGSAAEAFKLTVEGLILSMRDSAAAAQANEAPLIKITSLLSDAKDAIGQLRERWAANAAAEPGWIVQAMAPILPVPPTPVAPGWRDSLNKQARDIMHTTDVAIGQAATQFRSPVPFMPIGDPFANWNSIDPTDSTVSAPQIVPAPVFDLPAPAHAIADPGSLESGSRLGQDVTTLDGGLLPFPGQTVWPLASPNLAATFVDTPSGRVLAPGGVISAGGDALDNQNRTTGDGGAGGRGASGISGMMAPPIGRAAPGQSSRTGTRSGGRRRRRSDPDDPWMASTGGPSVLEPTPEPDYFDPGPNVIGLDR
jgi:hypothetical protein